MKKIFVIFSLGVAVAFSSCEQTSRNQLPEESTADTAVLKQNENRAGNDANTNNDLSMAEWDGFDLNMPTIRLPEITVAGLDVRGNDRYTSYSIDETVLFDTDKAQVRSAAKNSLQEVTNSIAQRSKEGKIRIYGHTDATASKDYNKELSEQRAQAVKQWLVSNGNIDESRISIHPMGESQPTASNQTEQGRQQNRRVDIVVMNTGNNNNNE